MSLIQYHIIYLLRGDYYTLYMFHRLARAAYRAEFVVYNQAWNGRNLHYPLPIHINSDSKYHSDITGSDDHIPYGVHDENACVNKILKTIHMRKQRVIFTKTYNIDNVKLGENFLTYH